MGFLINGGLVGRGETSAGLAVRLPLKDTWEKRGGGGVERGGGEGR